jgi:hypothetical protein
MELCLRGFEKGCMSDNHLPTGMETEQLGRNHRRSRFSVFRESSLGAVWSYEKIS